MIFYDNCTMFSAKSVLKKCSLCTPLLFPRNHFILDVECSLEIICSLKNQMSDGLRYVLRTFQPADSMTELPEVNLQFY